MAQEEPETLVVYLMDGRMQDRGGTEIHEIVTHMNSLQSHLEVVLNRPQASPGPEVLLMDGKGIVPYEPYPSPNTKNSTAIDLAFYKKHSAAVPLREYISYFVSIIVLGYLYRKWVGQDLSVFRGHEYSSTRDLIWQGTVAPSAKTVVERFVMAHPKLDRKPILDAVEKLKTAGLRKSIEMSTWAREVADHLNSLDLARGIDSYTAVQSHFHTVGPDLAEPLTRRFRVDDPQAVPQLADQIETHPTPRGIELLRDLEGAGKLDPRTRDYVQAIRVALDNRAKAGPDLDKGASGRMSNEADLIYADPERRKREFANLLPGIAAKLGEDTAQMIAIEINLAWTAVMEADGAISANMKKRIDDGSDTPIESFIIAMGDVGTEYTVHLLKILHDSIKLEPHVRKMARDALERAGVETETATSGQFGLHNDSTSGDDQLGYQAYAQAIADVVTNHSTDTPLTIAVGGPWGRGKSKLLDLICEAVDLRNAEKARPRCHSIRINAWELAKTEHIWAEFYGRLLDKVESELGLFRKIGLRIGFAFYRSPWSSVSLVMVAVALGAAVYHSPNIWRAISDIEVPSWVSKASAWGGIMLTVVGLLMRFGQRLSKRVFKGLESLSVRKTPGTEQEVLKNTGAVTSLLPKLTSDRFLISVDDIDRCSPEKTLELLEAIKLFLDTKGFVFFLAMDCRVVMHAVGEHYKFMSASNENDQDMGRQYLEKIIQVPFHLPPVGGERLKDLNKTLLDSYLTKPSQSTSTEKPLSPDPELDPPVKSQSSSKSSSTPKRRDPITNDNLARLDEIEYRAILSFLDRVDQDMSPRLLKRFVNVYMIARNMYIARQYRLEADSVVPPASFVHWLALSVVYPSEAKVVIGWSEQQRWTDPFDPSIGILSRDSRPAPYREVWTNHEPDRLGRFEQLYGALSIEHEIVKRTKHITNCFNLVLD